jgi:hypothetical protein
MDIQNNDITQGPLSIMYDILSLMNSTLLTADMILLCTKNPVPNSWFSFPFPQKNDQVKEDEMGRACSRDRREDECI